MILPADLTSAPRAGRVRRQWLLCGVSALAFGGLAAPAAWADGSGLGVTRDATIVPGASGGGTFSGLGSTYYPSRPQAEFTAPGSSAAGYAVSVAGMSTDGSVVLLNRNYSAVLDTTAFYAQPYIWTAQTGAVGLGFLPGTTWSNASAISGNGQAVVGNSWGASTYQAFRWTTATGTVGLGTLPGDTHSWANAVSADGSVVVGSSAGMNTTAFRWTAAAGMAGLGVLAGDTDSWATAVSADGSVVVGSSGHYDAYAWYAWAHYEQAFRWTAATGMIGLGILPGYVDSQATAVSADGSVVAGDSYSDSIWTLHQQALRWTAATGMVGLVICLAIPIAGSTA
ncbi:MAG: hypothetical protein ACJ8AW_28030 [Rhodopila sp.]